MSSSFLKRTRRICPFCSPPHAPPPSALPAQNGWTEVRCGLSGPLCTGGGCFGLFLKIFYFWENGFSYHSHRRDSSVHWKWWLCCTVSNEKKMTWKWSSYLCPFFHEISYTMHPNQYAARADESCVRSAIRSWGLQLFFCHVFSK